MEPEQLAKSNTEHAHQCALFCWAAQNSKQYPQLRHMFAIPNGGKRDAITAAGMKAEGVKKGVPDIFLPVAVGKWHGLFIELKRPKDAKKAAGTTSIEQDEWHVALRQSNYGVCIAFTWEQARDYVVKYLTWEKENA